MQGIFDFELTGNFADHFCALLEVTVFWQVRNPPDLLPIHRQRATQDNADELPGTIARRLILRWVHRNQHPFHQQVFRFHQQHFTIGPLHTAEGRPGKALRRPKQIHIHARDLPVARASRAPQRSHDLLSLAHGQGGRGCMAQVEVARDVRALRQDFNRRTTNDHELDAALGPDCAAKGGQLEALNCCIPFAGYVSQCRSEFVSIHGPSLFIEARLPQVANLVSITYPDY
ncbi:hypothetical protein SBV1_840012 [Verrucomicrobia bacterium]|nr:hypothetical protein SBV1_840012 [Verrucomicrobiota bacterium]